jgi:hypothetical protein
MRLLLKDSQSQRGVYSAPTDDILEDIAADASDAFLLTAGLGK